MLRTRRVCLHCYRKFCAACVQTAPSRCLLFLARAVCPTRTPFLSHLSFAPAVSDPHWQFPSPLRPHLSSSFPPWPLGSSSPSLPHSGPVGYINLPLSHGLFSPSRPPTKSGLATRRRTTRTQESGYLIEGQNTSGRPAVSPRFRCCLRRHSFCPLSRCLLPPLLGPSYYQL